MSVFLDGSGDDIRAAYEDVKNDGSDTTWAIFGYEGKQIKLSGTGTDYAEMLDRLTDTERFYCYVRFVTGEDMSERKKLVFITWIGPSVSPLKKAKVSTDKSFVKQICTEFGKEILADGKAELREDKVRATLEAASGAAYGTGK